MVSLGMFSTVRKLGRVLACASVVGFGVTLAVPTADARTGNGSSAGSRGAKTFTPPPATNTAPKAAQPVERSMAPPAAASSAAQAARPAVAPAAQPRMAAPVKPASRFGGGFGGMLMGGLLGAGLFGLLSGHGLFGGMSGLASILGLVLQAGLIAGVIWLAMSFFRGRGQAAMAGGGMAGGGMGNMSMANANMAQPAARPAASNLGGGYASNSAGASIGAAPLAIVKDDFDTFEGLLGRMQDAYGREDLAALRGLATPEMLKFLSDDLAENARKGLRNNISGVKLLQGDLAESWRESNAEFATVAMRFELVDAMVERSSGRVVAGHAQIPREVTEIWTFQRRLGGGAYDWRLSAIQQVS